MSTFNSGDHGAASERTAAYHAAIVESALDCVITIDHQGRVIEFNPAAEQTFGYSRQHVIGQPMAELIVPPSMRDAHYSGLRRYLETGEGRVLGKRIEVAAMRSDGSEFPVELAITPIILPGEPPAFTAYLRDITARVRAADLQETITRAQNAFIAGTHHREFFTQMLDGLIGLTQSEYGFIGEVLQSPEGTTYLKAYAITNIAWNDATRALYEQHADDGMEFHNLKTLFGAVITTGKPVIANDPAADARRGGLPEGHPPLHTFLGVPFKVGERMVGMVGVANRPGGYDELLINFLEPLLSTCANLILAWRAEKDRDRADQHLSEMAARHRSTLESAVDSIITIDERGIIDSVNPAAEKTFGYSAIELVGRNVSMLMPAPFDREHDGYITRYLATGEKRVIGTGREVPALRKDGSIFPADLAISEFMAGEKRFFTGILRDATARRRAEVRQAVELAAARCLAEAGDIEAGLKAALEAILTALRWQAGAYWQPDSASQVLQCVYFAHLPGDRFAEFRHISLSTSFARGIGLPGRVWETGQPLWVPDLSLDANFPRAPHAGAAGLRAGLAFPIQRRGRVTGIMEFFSTQIEQPDQELLITMAVLGNQIGEFIERKKAEADLHAVLADLSKSREDLLAVLNQIRIGIILLDQDGRISFLSEACAWLDPQERQAALGHHWQEVLRLPPHHQEALWQTIQRPVPERGRVAVVFTRLGGRSCQLEIDVKDDPRDPQRRLLYIYDVSELHELRGRVDRSRYGLMIGNSKPMLQLYELAEQLARGDWTVLIEGETGAGKELVARSIHAASPRKDGPFVAVNCGGLTESLLASQLFGHRRGAFTGAVSDQEGFFEAASGGTVFLDEIGDISPALQVSLLRVLQEREIVRLGDSRPRKVDVRILAATHRDLAQLVAEGKFREDLLYRLRVARIRVPSLRERRDDMPLLVAAFLAECRVATGKAVVEMDAQVMRRLREYHWPGNVRELKHAIESAVIRCRGSVIAVEDLPPEIVDTGRVPMSATEDALDEKSRILQALSAAGGNRSRAAALLGISRATLYRRLSELGLSESQREQ